MKTKIRTWLILILLFSLAGCDACGGGDFWHISIKNNLSYTIYINVIIRSRPVRTLGPIAPGEDGVVSEHYIFGNPEVHTIINKISIFSEDRTPLIILEGKMMDEYVICYREGDRAYFFRLEVEEELIGIGLDKKIDFEEIIEKTEDDFEEEIENERE